MKIRFLAGLIGLMVSIACNPSARETPVGLRPKLVMPAETSEPPSAPIAGRRRTEKLQLPPPMLPPPKADGQPQSPLDLKAITQAALDGKPITRAGIPNIERVDRLVQTIAAQKGMKSAVLDETVALVDARLELNRKAAK